MSTAILCIFLAYLMPYGFSFAAKTGKGMDNAKPREYLAHLKGWRLRAHWTQLNHFENFAPFAAAVVLSLQVGVDMAYLNVLAVTFVLARLIYGFCYIGDLPLARSLVWTAAQVCIVTLFILAMKAA